MIIETFEIEDLENGTCRIWCDTIQKHAIVARLGKDLIEKENDEDVIYSRTPPSQRKRGRPIEEKAVISALIVRGNYDDVCFALQDMVKVIRPYPRAT